MVIDDKATWTSYSVYGYNIAPTGYYNNEVEMSVHTTVVH